MATQRGRQSIEAQSVLGAVPLGVKPRPQVPVAFKDNSAEAELWRTIVAAETADWFHAGDLLLLEAFCRVTIDYRDVTRRCLTAEYVVKGAHGGQTINPIYKMQDMLAKQMASLAGKLRLSQNTRVSGHQAAAKAKNNNPTDSGLKPWQRAA